MSGKRRTLAIAAAAVTAVASDGYIFWLACDGHAMRYETVKILCYAFTVLKEQGRISWAIDSKLGDQET